MNEVTPQIKQIYQDQLKELERLRMKRRALLNRLVELDGEEIELLVGIEETGEILSKLKGGL